MERREAIYRVLGIMGGALSAPLIAGLLESCQPRTEENKTKKAADITDLDRRMIAEISEIIIPTTKTPGAKAAKVPEFIEMMLTECYSEKDQKSFFTGLAKLNDKADALYGDSFLELKPAQQMDLLKKEEIEAKAEKDKNKENKEAAAPFFVTMKELTLVGYFTSEIGSTQALQYIHVPGSFKGCVPLEPGQKAWAT